MSGDLVDATVTIHALLTALEVPHALCGGFAANLYRDEVRATEDVDFTIDLAASRLEAVVAGLQASGWTAERSWTHGNQLRLRADGFPRVDCIVARTDLERAGIEHARSVEVGEGITIPVLRAEDLIVQKLIAGRLRDLDAVASILRAHGTELDRDYIETWVSEFDAGEAWRRARTEAEQG